MARLVLVRHGKTRANFEGRFQGWSGELLSPEGVEEVLEMRERIWRIPFAAAFASDLPRAVQTARLLLDGKRTKLILSPELREVNFGLAEGLTFSELQSSFPEVARAILSRDPKVSFPQGEGLSDLLLRARSFLRRLRGREGDILIVAHDGSLRALLCLLLRLPPSFWFDLSPSYPLDLSLKAVRLRL